MAVKIRLARAGAKKYSYFKIVVTNDHAPRDGAFIEKVGYYNPMLPKGHQERVKLDNNRIEYWLSCGAWPTDKVLGFIKQFGVSLPVNVQKKYELKLKSRVPRPPKNQAKA